MPASVIDLNPDHGRVETVNKPAIACFGEMLWDCLPDGLFPGGAPMNVAVHLAALNRPALMISAVGDDFLGRELLRRLTLRKVDTSAVALHPDIETGVVLASIDASGNATYDLLEGVAWDHIHLPPDLLRPLAAVVFGSLALRSHHNRAALGALLDKADPNTLRVFDVNLRPPFDSLDRVRDWACRANLLKMNEHEAARLSGKEGQPEWLARDLAASHPGSAICITAGSRGAGLLRDDQWTWADAPAIEVADTVGAGDSFLAALIDGWLRHEAPSTTLARAVRVAAFVASARGATPDLPDYLRA